MSPNVSPRPSVSELTVSSNTKIEILGITLNHVVTIVGTPSYTSGAQLWNGAAAILNKNPAVITTRPSITPCVTLSDVVETEIRLLIASRLVRPVYAYTRADPSKIRADDNAPNRKYFSPADVADSFSR